MQPHSRRATTLAGVVTLIITVVAATFAPAAVADPAAAVPIVRLDGRGHGHGVGMSQWGAYTMARDGASAGAIIGAFYPGTELAGAGGEVVVVIDRRDHVRIRFPGGGEVRSARSGAQHQGFPVRVGAGGTVDIVRTPAGYEVRGGSVQGLRSSRAVRYSSSANQDCVLVVCPPGDGSSPSTTAPPADDGDGGDGGDGEPAPAPAPTPTPTTAPPPPPPSQPPPEQAGPPVSPTPVWAVPADGSLLHSVDRERTYRGLLEVTGAPGDVKVRNHVDVEAYLKGMAEVPGNWPAAAVQAQAIAARTYALRAMAAGGELCDSESCQVYAGTAHESPGQVAAVDATRGMVVTYGGALAATFYSASGGGFAANVAEGFGSTHDVPYLPAQPYPTVHPDEWTIDIALSDVARRLAYPGTVRTVTIDEAGPSGRPLRMTLHGDAGAVDVDPQEFRRRLGLRSTLFSVRTTETEVAPPPPPADPDPGVVGPTGQRARRTPTTSTSSTAAAPSQEEVALRSATEADDARRLAVVATAVAGALALATIVVLGRLAPTLVGDGVRRRYVGAPVVGLAWSLRELGRLRGRIAATMARWRSRRR